MANEQYRGKSHDFLDAANNQRSEANAAPSLNPSSAVRYTRLLPFFEISRRVDTKWHQHTTPSCTPQTPILPTHSGRNLMIEQNLLGPSPPESKPSDESSESTQTCGKPAAKVSNFRRASMLKQQVAEEATVVRECGERKRRLKEPREKKKWVKNIKRGLTSTDPFSSDWCIVPLPSVGTRSCSESRGDCRKRRCGLPRAIGWSRSNSRPRN